MTVTMSAAARTSSMKDLWKLQGGLTTPSSQKTSTMAALDRPSLFHCCCSSPPGGHHGSQAFLTAPLSITRRSLSGFGARYSRCSLLAGSEAFRAAARSS